MLDPSLYNQTRIIHLGQSEILPGTTSRANYSVGSLPSGTRVTIHMEVYRGPAPGPHVMIIGGVHGDEINGVEIVRQLLEKNVFNRLVRGSVIAVPLLNVYGFINFSREVPDGKDVNRSFPGTLHGSLASRVAGIVTRHVMPQADVLIDCHSGSQGKYNFPQLRISKDDPVSYALACAFNPPFILHKGLLRGSLRKIARGVSKPCLIYEGGEALRLDGYAIARGIAGIERTLQQLDMLDMDLPVVRPPVEIHHTTWIRASHAGMFIWSKSSGARVKKGEPLGTIGDPYGYQKVTVMASRDGYIIGHTNAPLVNSGDALFHIGY